MLPIPVPAAGSGSVLLHLLLEARDAAGEQLHLRLQRLEVLGHAVLQLLLLGGLHPVPAGRAAHAHQLAGGATAEQPRQPQPPS